MVNPSVGYPIARELYCVEEDGPYLEEQLEKLDGENPAISTWIRKYSDMTGDPIGAKYCALIVYRMLASQVEADRMAESIRLG